MMIGKSSIHLPSIYRFIHPWPPNAIIPPIWFPEPSIKFSSILLIHSSIHQPHKSLQMSWWVEAHPPWTVGIYKPFWFTLSEVDRVIILQLNRSFKWELVVLHATLFMFNKFSFNCRVGVGAGTFEWRAFYVASLKVILFLACQEMLKTSLDPGEPIWNALSSTLHVNSSYTSKTCWTWKVLYGNNRFHTWTPFKLRDNFNLYKGLKWTNLVIWISPLIP